MEEKTLFSSRPNLSSVPVLGDLGCEKQQVLMKHSLSWAAQEFATTLGFWIWNLFNLQQLGFADLGAVDGIGGVHFCLEPFVSDLACALCLASLRVLSWPAWLWILSCWSHTWYLCKFFLAGVNFYRFNAKNWQFTVYFAVITQKIGNFLCILS